MFNTQGYSLSDVAAAAGNEGFGGNSWIWLLLFIVLLGGGGLWGNNMNVGTNRVASAEDVFNQTLISKLDNLGNGVCDATYALNNTITGGFANAELSKANQQAQVIAAINDVNYKEQANACTINNNVQTGFSNLGYELATQSNQTRQTIQDTTNQILAKLNADSIEAKNAKIAEQAQQIFALQLSASQQAQNAYLVNKLNPTPIPAYITCSPYASASYTCPYSGTITA